MHIHFYKYQGAGNDFVVIDDRSRSFDIDNQPLVEYLCDRRFGIGGDGLMLLRDHPELDFEMVYFNSDGRVGSMCGNGGRCIVHFAHFLGLFTDKTTFMAADGLHEAHIDASGLIHLKMNPPADIEKGEDFFFLNTGSPHYVRFEEDLDDIHVYAEGRTIRNSERFSPAGTNVNFAQVKGDQWLRVRTYERGVEDETLACGTGVTAAVIAMHEQFGTPSPVEVDVEGGRLFVSFQEQDGRYEQLYLIGPAVQVFEGRIQIS